MALLSTVSSSNWNLVFVEGGKPEYPEKNPRSKDENLGIEHEPHWWEASALTTAPSLLPQFTYLVQSFTVSPINCLSFLRSNLRFFLTCHRGYNQPIINFSSFFFYCFGSNLRDLF